MDYRPHIDHHFNDALSGNRQESPSAPVDIVIPIYNSFEYVERCVESVLLNSESPYRLILINDCSTDPRIKTYLDEMESRGLPEPLDGLDVIHNEHNLGFTQTANIGMGRSDRHVILLNSDTLVPPNWIGRMIAPILRDNGIASVSPFSNNAWICSFPDWNQEHELPEHLSVQEMDDLFFRYGFREPIELPSTIGFCMALNRYVIDRIGLFDHEYYGKGYCEEGDWCFRAKTAGYRNVLAPNLFVYHKMGASFNLQTDQSRDERIEENVIKWAQRYPELFAGIEVFMNADPLLPVRTVLRSAVEARNRAHEEGVLLIDPNGTLDGSPDSLRVAGKRIYLLSIVSDGLLLSDPNIDGGVDYTLFPECAGMTELHALLTMLCIQSVSY